MVISQSKKADFKPYVKIANDVFDFRWGKEDFVLNDGETSSICTYELHRFFGNMPTKHQLDIAFAKATRIPKIAELKEIGEAIGMTEAEMLPWMKEYLLKAIRKYDKSKNVEDFTINGIHMWLDGDLRKKVEENLSYCQHMGIEETVLRYEGMEFPMSVEMGWNLYYAVLGYARATWDVTQIHEASVPKIDTIQGMLDYEESYPSAYPQKLAF